MTTMPRPTILLVDDDHEVREMLRECLTDAGFNVISAEDTVAGLRHLEAQQIDLCLVDLVMPEGVPDGAAFAQLAHTHKPPVPVILMTGYFTAAERARGLGLVVYKPIPLDQLVAEINDQLSAGKQAKQTNS